MVYAGRPKHPMARVAVLGFAIASFAAAPVHAGEILVGGSGATLGGAQRLAEAYAAHHPEGTIKVLPSMGSSGGIKAVAAGAIQIALSTRPLKPAETAAGLVSIAYATTPFVFATSKGTAASAITTAELAEMFTGRRDRWPDGGRVRLVLRPASDSDNDVIGAISPAMSAALAAAHQRPGMAYGITDQETATLIETVPGAIGPSTLALIVAEGRDLKALALDGVAADAPEYPLHKPMFIVTSPHTSAEAQRFVAFFASAEGREILARTGHQPR